MVGASITMEQAATALGRRYAVADIIVGALVLAVVTSLPNAVTAVYLARRGRGAAVLSTALNSNAINVTAGLLVPASLTGLGPRSGQDILVAAWYMGLTVFALALAYRDRGLGRIPGVAIIVGYLAFVTALLISVAQGKVSPAAAALPAVGVAAAGALLLTRSLRWQLSSRTVMASLAREWRRESLLPGWSVGRLWKLSFILCSAVAACDAASGPRLILIGLLIVGPCCALLTGRWALTATASCFAFATRRRARRARPDLRHRHPVHVLGRHRSRQYDRHHQRGNPPASASVNIGASARVHGRSAFRQATAATTRMPAGCCRLSRSPLPLSGCCVWAAPCTSWSNGLAPEEKVARLQRRLHRCSAVSSGAATSACPSTSSWPAPGLN